LPPLRQVTRTQAIEIEECDEFEEEYVPKTRATVARYTGSLYRRDSVISEMEKSYVRPEVGMEGFEQVS
jgi:hypothetical protein